MKKTLLLIACLASFSVSAMACDICGCGAGSSYLGILPDFNAKIVGLRFRNSEIRTHVGPNGQSSYLTTTEHYNTFELWGGWNLGKHFRIMATLPLNYDSKTTDDGHESMTGLGDATVQGFYHLYQHKTTLKNSKLLVQDLWIGGGIKLPTGKYNPHDEETTNENANLFQLGTNSFDFMLTAMYDIRLQDLGLNISASYKMNTTNSYAYNYGNKMSINAQFYYKFRIKDNLSIAPNAGLSYEIAGKDLNDGDLVFTTGGYAFFGTAGAELKYKDIALGCNYQPSIAQHLGEGIVQARNKMMVHVAVSF